MKTYRNKKTGVEVNINKTVLWKKSYVGEGIILPRELVENSSDWEEVIEYPVGTKMYNSQTDCVYTRKEDGWYKPSDKTAYTDATICRSKHITPVVEDFLKKDYEILSFKNDYGQIFTLKKDSYKLSFESEKADYSWRTLEHMLTIATHCVIYSIKRISDGKIFTSGDFVEHTKYPSLTCNIDSFYINKNGACLIHSNDGGFSEDISLVKKVKEPLFTTEDGMEIYRGDRYWIVDSSTFRIFSCKSFGVVLKHSSDLYFSSEEIAKDYILKNKPLLSLKDVFSVYPEYKKDGVTRTKHAEDIIQTVKRNEVI